MFFSLTCTTPGQMLYDTTKASLLSSIDIKRHQAYPTSQKKSNVKPKHSVYVVTQILRGTCIPLYAPVTVLTLRWAKRKMAPLRNPILPLCLKVKNSFLRHVLLHDTTRTQRCFHSARIFPVLPSSHALVFHRSSPQRTSQPIHFEVKIEQGRRRRSYPIMTNTLNMKQQRNQQYYYILISTL